MKKTGRIIDLILGIFFTTMAIILLTVSIVLFFSTIYDADVFTAVVIKMIPIILCAASVCLSVKSFKRWAA